MFEARIIKRIPGSIPVQSAREKQGYIDFSTKTKVELVELLERQNKIISNKKFILSLPDKGERILIFKRQLEFLISESDKIDETCGLLSGLHLNAGKNVTEEIEWTGNYSRKQNPIKTVDNDDCDEERNPLKILATQSGIGRYIKHYRILEREESLIKPEDLKDVESFTKSKASCSNTCEDSCERGPEHERRLNMCNDSSIIAPIVWNGQLSKDVHEDDLYVQTLCDKFDRPREQKRESFKPHRTTRSGVHLASHVLKPKGPHWEVTAATPPYPIHGDVKGISLQASLQLQKEQDLKLKEIQTKRASEKLFPQLGLKMGSELPDPTHLMQFHQRMEQYDSSSSEDEKEEKEHSQGEEEDEVPEKDGAVIYNITD